MKPSAQKNHKINLLYCTTLFFALFKLKLIIFILPFCVFLPRTLRVCQGCSRTHCGRNKLSFPRLFLCFFPLSHSRPCERLPNRNRFSNFDLGKSVCMNPLLIYSFLQNICLMSPCFIHQYDLDHHHEIIFIFSSCTNVICF